MRFTKWICVLLVAVLLATVAQPARAEAMDPILISLIDAGTAALIAAQSSGDSSVVIAPQGASDVVAEVLRQTVNIPPTIRVPQGERLQVLVARDVTFAAVYALAHR